MIEKMLFYTQHHWCGASTQHVRSINTICAE